MMNNIKEIVGHILLDIKAVHFYYNTPFVFTSGTSSPVYVDCRKLISFPEQRKKVLKFARQIIKEEFSDSQIDVIAGGETAGIPYAAWLADHLDLPMIYVRKTPKGFGRLKQIEGILADNQRVLLVEDLLFDAKSKINFCQAIRNAGAIVRHTIVIFDYANSESRDNLIKHNIELHSLTDWPTLLSISRERGYFSESQAKIIRSFLDDPKGWTAINGS